MIIYDNDTICAISTPPGTGGIALVRVSGSKAIEIVNALWTGKDLRSVESHSIHLGTINDYDSNPLDQCVISVFRAPRSFTGDDVVEISVHGSKWVQRRLIEVLIKSGCRLADPGEFTRKAFIAGKMDLAEAEAVADIIASDSRAAHRIAITQLRGGFSRKLQELRSEILDLASLLELELDFSEEDVEFASRKKLKEIADEIYREISSLKSSFVAGNAIKDGIPIAIVGATNAGKSSLLNAILGDNRAIVSDVHGTTRDTIEETIELGDFRFRFIDTAGFRQTTDQVELIGIERSKQAIAKARVVIVVVDSTSPLDFDVLTSASEVITQSDSSGYMIVALNKADLQRHDTFDCNAVRSFLDKLHCNGHIWTISISAKEGTGINDLRKLLIMAAETDCGSADEGILVTNARHVIALSQASESTARVIDGLNANISGDLIAQDLRETIAHLSSITGNVSSSEILESIFSRFCIGK